MTAVNAVLLSEAERTLRGCLGEGERVGGEILGVTAGIAVLGGVTGGATGAGGSVGAGVWARGIETEQEPKRAMSGKKRGIFRRKVI